MRNNTIFSEKACGDQVRSNQCTGSHQCTGSQQPPQVSSKLNHPTPHLQEQELLWLHSWLDWYLAEKQAAERLSHRLLLQDPATVVPRLQSVANVESYTESGKKEKRERIFLGFAFTYQPIMRHKRAIATRECSWNPALLGDGGSLLQLIWGWNA